jgi:hypothetical protein
MLSVQRRHPTSAASAPSPSVGCQHCDMVSSCSVLLCASAASPAALIASCTQVRIFSTRRAGICASDAKPASVTERQYEMSSLLRVWQLSRDASASSVTQRDD